MLFADPATLKIPSEADALPGRDEAIALPNGHYVHGRPIAPPFPEEMAQAVFQLHWIAVIVSRVAYCTVAAVIFTDTVFHQLSLIHI
mgnify:CR=1 FL=1